MKTNIYQIYFKPDQLPLLEKCFIPYDNSASHHIDEREYWVFLDNFIQNKIADDTLTGYVSWKFRQKTNMTGEMFLQFINDNPNYDVYFINPFPLNTHIYKNVWEHGNFHHPDLMTITQSILKKAGYHIQLQNIINDETTAAFCNYWVGNKRFWTQYINFTSPLYHYIKNNLNDKEKLILNTRADKIIDANYFPFIFERMFSTLLTADSTIQYLGKTVNK